MKGSKLVMENNRLIIGICDDEQSIHSTVDFLMKEYEEKHHVCCRIVHFYSGNEVLKYENDLDVLLLDIEMPHMDGIETGERLRERGIAYKLIMLTGNKERFKEAFKIEAFRFVTKPVEMNEFFEAMDSARESLLGGNMVSVLRDGVIFEIMQKNITYIEGNKTTTNVYTKSMEYKSSLSLGEWMKQLENKLFFQCHKSYIVNLSMIEDIGEDRAILITGEQVQIARRRRTELLQAFMEYDTRYR